MDPQVVQASQVRQSETTGLRSRFTRQEGHCAGVWTTEVVHQGTMAGEHHQPRLFHIFQDTYQTISGIESNVLLTDSSIQARGIEGPLRAEHIDSVGTALPTIALQGLFVGFIGTFLAGPVVGVVAMLGGMVLGILGWMVHDCHQYRLPTVAIGAPIGWPGTALMPRASDGSLITLDEDGGPLGLEA